MNPIKTAYGWFFFHSSFSWPLGRYDDPRPLENLAYWNFGVFAGGAEAVAMVAAIAAAASSERGVTGAVGVGGEARGGTFHMNQSSGGSGTPLRHKVGHIAWGLPCPISELSPPV